MASKSSTKKGKTAIDDNPSNSSVRPVHKLALDAESHSDTADVGSSRRRRVSSISADTMGRSASPNELNRTRTGRVSKAAKGQPVHHCHCGKTYTRAEHLRRHQQNHKPGAFPCDVQGCVRAFYREDLLTRHKLKHDETPGSTDFLLSHDLGGRMICVCEVDSRASQHQPSTGTRKDYIPIAELQPSTIGLTVGHAPVEHDRRSNLGLDPSPFYSFGSGYNTPEQGYQTYGQLHSTSTFDAAQPWTTQPSSLFASQSPVSRNSTTPTPLGRRPSLYTQLRTPNSEVSYCDTRNHASSFGDSYLGDAFAMDITTMPEYRDMVEQDELVTPTSAPQAANFGQNQYRHRADNEQRYMEAFWRSVHPAWPVLHRHTFDPSRTSPLLRAAMITLGAHSTGHPIDSGNACILHKRCLKVIRKRNINHSHSFRMEDMQAILLVELFATTRSLRPPLQLSKPFVDTCHYLAREYDADTTNALFATINSFDSLHGTPCTLEAESTRRLLVASYALNIQHSKFFGREATEIPDFDLETLSLPQPLHLWDMAITPQAVYYGEIHCDHFFPQPLLHQATMGLQPSGEPLDIFTSMLLLAYTHSKAQDLPPDASHLTPTPSSYQSPHVQVAHQTFALTILVPVRALLAVAGESWIQAEKLSSRAEYSKAQNDIRKWTASAAATIALPVAIGILRLHRQHPKTTFLFHEWSLHLAVLVVWAKFYGGRDSTAGEQMLRLEVPSSSVVFGMELDGDVAQLMNGGVNPGAEFAWQDAKRLLTWAKGRLEKTGVARFCGVVNGAKYVLAALVERGDEDGWF
ncbi:hypothetical protein Q7P36_002439 [Cladosporium allicinum]